MRQDIEFLRILGAAGVVWFHLGISAQEIGYGGLVLFIALGAYFSIVTSGRLSSQFFVKRAVRILIPWLFWVFIFGLINIVRGYPAFPKGDSTSAAILIGPSVHLWYLPFALVVAVVSGILGQVLSRRSQLGLGSSSRALAFHRLACCWPSMQQCHIPMRNTSMPFRLSDWVGHWPVCRHRL